LIVIPLPSHVHDAAGVVASEAVGQAIAMESKQHICGEMQGGHCDCGGLVTVTDVWASAKALAIENLGTVHGWFLRWLSYRRDKQFLGAIDSMAPAHVATFDAKPDVFIRALILAGIRFYSVGFLF
jgi:hypothetical protein